MDIDIWILIEKSTTFIELFLHNGFIYFFEKIERLTTSYIEEAQGITPNISLSTGPEL